MSTAQMLPDAEIQPTVRLDVAARALGVSRDTAYRRAASGWLLPGVPVLRVGGLFKVPTRPLRLALGLDND